MQNDPNFFFLISERCMRPSESSVENDSIVFTYAQRFSKMPDDDSVATKRVHPKRPLPVAGLSLEKTDSEEQNKDVNSSDTENASPAIAYGPKNINSVSQQELVQKIFFGFFFNCVTDLHSNAIHFLLLFFSLEILILFFLRLAFDSMLMRAMIFHVRINCHIQS